MSVSLRFLLCLVVFVLEQTIYSVLSASTVGSILVQVRGLFLKTVSCLLLHTPSTCFDSRYGAPLEHVLSVPFGQNQTRGILQPRTLGTPLTARQRAHRTSMELAGSNPPRHMYGLCAGSLSATAVSCSCCTALCANVNIA